MKIKTDETRTSQGSEGPERGVGCAGVGLPDTFRFHPEDSSLVDDLHHVLGGFPVNLTEEEDLGFAGPLKD